MQQPSMPCTSIYLRQVGLRRSLNRLKMFAGFKVALHESICEVGDLQLLCALIEHHIGTVVDTAEECTHLISNDN